MPISTLGLIIINIGLALLQRLVAPRLPRPKAQPFEAPTIEEGKPFSKGFGLFQADGIVTALPETSSVPQGDTGITFYFAKMQIGFGYGPIHVIYDIISDERSVRLQQPGKLQSLAEKPEPLTVSPPFPITVTGPGPIPIILAVRQIFGGRLAEGGLQGEIRFYGGFDDQPVDPLVEQAVGEDLASAYPHLAYACFGQKFEVPTGSALDDDFYWIANNPTPKPISFLLGYYPNTLLGDDGKVGAHDANPIEMLYDTYTNPVWGKNESPATFDTAQLQLQARRCKSEGLGLSGLFVNRSIEDFTDDVLSHINGELVTDPVTGLIQIKLARDDYNIASLPIIDHTNSDNFRQGEAQFAETLNEIKVRYRRFDSGTSGPTTEVLVEDMGQGYFSLDGYYYTGFKVQSQGRNISDVSVVLTREGTDYTLVFLTDYGFNAATGWFQFREGPVSVSPSWQEGDRITATYTAAPTFSGFVDATATSQNLANRQILGRVQSETYDYPMFTTEFNAQAKADLLKLTVSRKLAVFQWTMGREGAFYTPMDVVKIHDPAKYRLSNFPVRITKVTIGTLEQPEVTIEAVEDVWGERHRAMFPNPSVSEPPPPPPPIGKAPPLAAFFCQCEDDPEELGLQASDTTFQIEIWRADDVTGLNAELAEIVDGTTVTWIDPVPDKAHRARLIRDGWEPGDWTNWLADCDGAGTPGCVLPTVSDTPVEGETTGTLNTFVINEQGRLITISYSTQAAGQSPTDFVIAMEPFSATVPLVAGQISYITRRAEYFDCDGNAQVSDATYAFTVPAPPETPPDAILQVPVELVLGWDIGIRDAGPEAVPFASTRWNETKFPLNAFKAIRWVLTIKKSTFPVGGAILCKFEALNGSNEYVDISEDQGPAIPLDEASLDLLDPNPDRDEWVVNGPWVAIRPEAMDDVRIAGYVLGGDGTSELGAPRAAVQLTAQPQTVTVPPVEDDTPVEENPGSCETPSTLDVTDHDSQVEPSGAVWSVDGTDVVLTVDGSGTGPASQEVQFTGTPNEFYTFYLKVTGDVVGIGAFLEFVGGEIATATVSGQILKVQGTLDGSGHATLRWGIPDVGDVPGSGGSWDTDTYAALPADPVADGFTLIEENAGSVGADSSVVLDPVIKDTGADSILFHISHPSYNSGKLYFSQDIPGFPANAAYSMTCRMRMGGIRGYGNPIFQAGATQSFSGTLPPLDTWGTVTVSGHLAADGIARVKWGIDGGIGVNYPGFSVWFDGVIRLAVAGGGSAEIHFSDLGYCLGSGVGDGGTGNGPSGTDPPPPEPPGGFPPPPVGESHLFGIAGISVGGYSYWKSTQKPMRTTNGVDLLNLATTNGTQNFFKAGNDPDYLDGGGFNETYWQNQWLALKNDARTNAAIVTALLNTARPFFAGYLQDEPFHPRWGGRSSMAMMARMGLFVKDLWNNMPTMMRIPPDSPHITGHISGVDYLWAEYKLSSGDPVAWRDRMMALAAALGHLLIIGLHYGSFPRPATGIVITTPQLITYGDIMADVDPAIVAGHSGWQFTLPMYNQPGFPDALRRYRDRAASNYP